MPVERVYHVPMQPAHVRMGGQERIAPPRGVLMIVILMVIVMMALALVTLHGLEILVLLNNALTNVSDAELVMLTSLARVMTTGLATIVPYHPQSLLAKSSPLALPATTTHHVDGANQVISACMEMHLGL